MPNLLTAFTSRLKHRQAMRDLRGLPDYLLKDIGISRGEIPYLVRTGGNRNER